MKPFLKWAGGKHRLADNIRTRFARPCTGVYREPFAGSLAIYLDRAAAGEVQEAVLSDANAKLIGCYKAVRNEVDNVLEALSELPIEPGWESHYYRLRDEFNDGPHTGARHAARFIWINRASFNGLYRENRSGRFNVPVGRYRRPSLPSEETLRMASKLLQRARIETWGYDEALRDVGDGDQIYCDPPYVPLSKTASFTAYSKEGFGALDQRRLAEMAAAATDSGSRFVMSNHATTETRRLYKGLGFRVSTVAVQRSISCKGGNRWKARELLAVKG